MIALLARTFSSGCAALTGVEAISNGVPAFRKPKSKNAATTLLLLGTIAVTMLIGVITLANLTGLKLIDEGHSHYTLNGQRVEVHEQTAIGQLSQAVFADFMLAAYFVIAATFVILFLAANTAFNGFPVLGSILARDGYLPRQLHTRGDRLAFSNGIIVLALLAIVLIIAYQADVTSLIQLYVVGVFVSFTISQLGMLRHWTRLLRTETNPTVRARMQRSRVINGVGLTMTGTVLVIVLLSKFAQGAYIAIIAMAVLFVMMKAIQRHYRDGGRPRPRWSTVRTGRCPAASTPSSWSASCTSPHCGPWPTPKPPSTAPWKPSPWTSTPKRPHGWCSDGRTPTSTFPSRSSPRPTGKSPTRSSTTSATCAPRTPRDVVTVYIPEYVVGHWWEQILHNQSALRLKGRLLFTPGVMVTSVPYLLKSSAKAEQRAERDDAADSARRTTRLNR